MEMLREKFLKAYANVPLGMRGEIILIVDDKPVTWDVAYLEIKENTSRAAKILEGLKNIGIIQP